VPLRPGELQPFAPGLLSLFDLKQRGENPDTLSNQVMLTVEALEWYVLAKDIRTTNAFQGMASIPAASSVARTSAIGGLSVPAGQWWRIHSLTATLQDPSGTATAVDLLQWAPVYQDGNQSAGSAAHVGPSAPRWTATWGAGSPAINFRSPSFGPFWAPPLTTFGIAMAGFYTNAANAPLIGVEIRFTPLLV
jgi:hypothetical protein